jgi:hypothetical protein
MTVTKFKASSVSLRSADEILQEAEAFFMRGGKVYAALKRLTHDLQDADIAYVIVGGMALNLWGYARQTVDVDILLTREGLAKFNQQFVGRGYTLAFSGAAKSFREADTQVKIEVLTTGDYPGDGKPKPVAFPNPADVSVDRDGYHVIALEKLIELKLASGLSAPQRGKDLVDVQELIAILKLPLALAEQLDESVRAEYRNRWELAHYEDDLHGRE